MPRSGAKERPTVHDSVEQRCTNHSSQVMALFGTQLRNSCYRSYIHKCTTSTGVTVVWVLQLPYMVKAREEKSSRLGHRCSQLLDAPWHHFVALMGSWCDRHSDLWGKKKNVKKKCSACRREYVEHSQQSKLFGRSNYIAIGLTTEYMYVCMYVSLWCRSVVKCSSACMTQASYQFTLQS